jgi:3-isopropylmalate/(R)-2-methylmalate dehydratase small subunit
MPAFPGGLHAGIVIPLDRRNVDTDAIFPKQYGRSTAKTGYGAVLFDSWRYLDPGDIGSDHALRRPDPSFVLNRPELRGASVLLARDNFGCGSSREHAVWALRDYGIRAVLAPGFGDIFRQNCPLNGVAAITLRPADVDSLFDAAAAAPLEAAIDLGAGTVRAAGVVATFSLAAREQLLLTQDLDWIGATLAHRDRIAAFERERLARCPWLQRMYPRT